MRSDRLGLVVLVVAGIASLLSWVAPASAAVAVGQSGWTWGNPLPQGNDVNGLEFLGNRGYAAGKFGTLLRTDDGGSTWIGLSTGITGDLSRVRIIDADSLVFAGGCAVRRSDDAGATFVRLPWTASDLNCPEPIVSLSFPTDQIGYLVVSNGTVFRTADGGRTWARRTGIPGTRVVGTGSDATDVFFTGPDTGVATTTSGRIYRTTDGGGSWTLALQHSKPLKGVFFVDSNFGFAVGDQAAVFRTLDAGMTWASASPGGTGNINSIRCADRNNCLATVENADFVLRTTNGGSSFTSVTPSTDRVLAAAFASPARAVAAGRFGTTVVSNDGGGTWSTIGGRIVESFSRLRATSATLAFAPGRNGALARTVDGGLSWTALGVSTSANVVDVSFPTQAVGFALDSAGSVLRTDNGGTSWQILNTGTSAKPTAILALDGNRILLVGPRGIRRSSNGGNEFARIRGKAVSRARLTDIDRIGNTVYAYGSPYGSRALLLSTNGGKTWKKLKLPRLSRRAALESVDFVSSRAAFALTSDGRLWQTRNRGRRWKELLVAAVDQLIEVSFSSSKRGYVAANGFGNDGFAYAFRTTDGGKTWRPQLVGESYEVRHSLVATGDNTALLLAGGTPLLATTTGGDAGTPSRLTLRTERRKLRRPTTIKVSGKLSPPEGGEQAVVSMRGARDARWSSKNVTVASNGTFTTSWKVERTSLFVAHWRGDDDRAGDGSNLFAVRVGR